MKTIIKTKIFILLFFFVVTANAQRVTEIGLNGGGVRFYPKVQQLGYTSANRMDNGWGWSAGLFLEDHWKPRIHQIIELNYYNLFSDVYLQKSPYGENGYGYQQPVYDDFDETSFDHLAISAGIKYFFTPKIFAYPAIEAARALNADVNSKKTDFNLKFAAGIDLKSADIMLEYAYGLNHQQKNYDSDGPFTGTHRNRFLQAKIQVPVFRFK